MTDNSFKELHGKTPSIYYPPTVYQTSGGGPKVRKGYTQNLKIYLKNN